MISRLFDRTAFGLECGLASSGISAVSFNSNWTNPGKTNEVRLRWKLEETNFGVRPFVQMDTINKPDLAVVVGEY